MKVTNMPMYVGKRTYDDNIKIELPGTLIKPESRSDITLILEAGLNCHHQNYISHFGRLLANDFNVYISEIRNKGFWKVNQSPDDFSQVDEKIRDITETDKIFYLGHCMGMNIAVEAKNKHNKDIMGMYGICTYPSIGFTRTKSEDLNNKSLQERLIDYIPRISFLGYPLKESQIEEPVRFAIAEKDELLNINGSKDMIQRFKTFFYQYPKATCKVFDGRYHCFNNKRGERIPFNVLKPDMLVDDITRFVYWTMSWDEFKKEEEAKKEKE